MHAMSGLAFRDFVNDCLSSRLVHVINDDIRSSFSKQQRIPVVDEEVSLCGGRGLVHLRRTLYPDRLLRQ